MAVTLSSLSVPMTRSITGGKKSNDKSQSRTWNYDEGDFYLELSLRPDSPFFLFFLYVCGSDYEKQVTQKDQQQQSCESWTLTAELQRRIQTMEMRCLPQDTAHLIQRPCYQRGSPCQDPAGNRTTWRSSDDRKKTQTAVVWSCFPFIRSGQNHLAKHSERGRRQGGQRKRWEDNIREWTGLEFGKSQRAVENREKWRKLIVKSSVVPQRHSRLRDWWWWWWPLIAKLHTSSKAYILLLHWHFCRILTLWLKYITSKQT